MFPSGEVRLLQDGERVLQACQRWKAGKARYYNGFPCRKQLSCKSYAVVFGLLDHVEPGMVTVHYAVNCVRCVECIEFTA